MPSIFNRLPTRVLPPSSSFQFIARLNSLCPLVTPTSTLTPLDDPYDVHDEEDEEQFDLFQSFEDLNVRDEEPLGFAEGEEVEEDEEDEEEEESQEAAGMTRGRYFLRRPREGPAYQPQGQPQANPGREDIGRRRGRRGRGGAGQPLVAPQPAQLHGPQLVPLVPPLEIFGARLVGDPETRGRAMVYHAWREDGSRIDSWYDCSVCRRLIRGKDKWTAHEESIHQNLVLPCGFPGCQRSFSSHLGPHTSSFVLVPNSSQCPSCIDLV